MRRLSSQRFDHGPPAGRSPGRDEVVPVGPVDAGVPTSGRRPPVMTLAADNSYPLLDLMWTMFLFFGLFIFFWLLIMVFGDLFRRDDVGGWAKTGWTVFVIVLPLIGTFTYLISQGRGIAERRARDVQTSQQQMDAYIRSVAGSESATRVDDIAEAKRLLDNGAISADEFEALKN